MTATLKGRERGREICQEEEDVSETREEGLPPSYHSDLLYCIIF